MNFKISWNHNTGLSECLNQQHHLEKGWLQYVWIWNVRIIVLYFLLEIKVTNRNLPHPAPFRVVIDDYCLNTKYKNSNFSKSTRSG